MWDWQHVSWDLTKLVIAAVIGGAIGFEREAHGQAAGLRTYILVSVGACLMMMLSMEMEHFYRHLSVDQSVVRLDPARIASYAIASMGFLGAGAIITGKGTVRGLTTAAGLWLVTGIGLGVILAGIFIMVATVVTSYTNTAYHTCLYLWARDVEKSQASGSTAQVLAPAPLAAVLNQ